MFEYLQDLISTASNLKTLLAIGSISGGVALTSAGAVPKIGLGRSISLAVKSVLQTASPESVRKVEMASLLAELNAHQKGRYIVITGGKGYGKSCLIDSTLSRRFGVVKISVRNFSIFQIFCFKIS
jgi:hypothetical protein